jgi:branched-chain amino acid transport system substrate-binding protein
MSLNKSLLPLLVLAAIALAACGKSETQTAASSAPSAADELVVKIGASAPLTGPQAHIGKDNENGRAWR